MVFSPAAVTSLYESKHTPLFFLEGPGLHMPRKSDSTEPVPAEYHTGPSQYQFFVSKRPTDSSAESKTGTAARFIHYYFSYVIPYTGIVELSAEHMSSAGWKMSKMLTAVSNQCRFLVVR